MASTSSKSLVFLLICGLIFSALVPASADFFADEFKKWVTDHRVKYNSKLEALKRFAIFKANYLLINDSNNNPQITYKLGLNGFADLTNDEFLAKFTGDSPPTSSLTSTSTSFKYGNVAAPSSIDWRDLGAVTDVKNQGECGSCWAFGAVATIEGITKIRKGYLPILSEQELLDCVNRSHGCAGGWQDYAFDWVINNGGITTEENYVYTAQNGTCDTTKTENYAARITGYEIVPQYNETALMNAVACQPVTVTVDATYFQFYQSGIYTGRCGVKLNHAVTAVGYGTQGGINYWIVKNSWGTTWGEDGYIRIWKDSGYQSGMCGIALHSLYPVA